MNYDARERMAVEALRAFDGAALAMEVERRLRWINHCATVHARGEVTDCGGTPLRLCSEQLEKH